LKANKIFFFLQNLSKFTPFASFYSDPAYGHVYPGNNKNVSGIKKPNHNSSLLIQCLTWTVAQSPNVTNILFGRPKAKRVLIGSIKINIWGEQ
jgi:hypothetical protein